MTMHKALHPKNNVGRLYLPRKSGGRRLLRQLSVEDTAARSVRGGVTIGESVRDLKKRQKREKFESWKNKHLHGVY